METHSHTHSHGFLLAPEELVVMRGKDEVSKKENKCAPRTELQVSMCSDLACQAASAAVMLLASLAYLNTIKPMLQPQNLVLAD